VLVLVTLYLLNPGEIRDNFVTPAAERIYKKSEKYFSRKDPPTYGGFKKEVFEQADPVMFRNLHMAHTSGKKDPQLVQDELL